MTLAKISLRSAHLSYIPLTASRYSLAYDDALNTHHPVDAMIPKADSEALAFCNASGEIAIKAGNARNVDRHPYFFEVIEDACQSIPDRYIRGIPLSSLANSLPS